MASRVALMVWLLAAACGGGDDLAGPPTGLIEHAACVSAGRLYVTPSAGVLSALVAPE